MTSDPRSHPRSNRPISTPLCSKIQAFPLTSNLILGSENPLSAKSPVYLGGEAKKQEAIDVKRSRRRGDHCAPFSLVRLFKSTFEQQSKIQEYDEIYVNTQIVTKYT